MTRGRRFGLVAIAFAAMLVVLLLLMVRFTGARAPAPDPVAAMTAPIATRAVRIGALTLPVAGVDAAKIVDSWGDPRGGGTRPHLGTDIMAPQGTPVVAAAGGRVEKLFDSAAGGRTLYVRSPGGRLSFYYAHLSGYAPGIGEGSVVRAGDPLGYVGDTGNAGPGNYHLHFGVHVMAPDDSWSQGRAVNPYPLLVGNAARR